MELQEAGTEAAQIVTKTVIEHDSEFSYLFTLPPLTSSSTTRPQCNASPSGRDEMSEEVHGEFLMPSRRDEMLPSDVDEMSNVLSFTEGRVKEGQTRVLHTFTKVNMSASPSQMYPMEGRVREGQTHVPQTVAKANPSTSPLQKLYGKLHTSPKSDVQNVAMNRNA